MRLNRFVGFLLTLVMSASLVACGVQTQPSTPDPGQAKLTPVSIRLDWTTNALHAPLYAALEQGYYRAAGLDVTINQATDKDDVLKLVDTGIDTLGLFYQSSVLKAPSRGYNVKVVGAYVQHPLNVILVDQRAQVNSLKELEGKTVGFTSDPLPKGALSTTAASLKMMVEKAGGDFSKIKLLNVGDAGIQALATQNVHALGGVYEYHEKYLLDREGIKTFVYRLHEHGAPDFYELLIVASEKVATEQAEMIKKFIKATEQGLDYAQKNPEATVELLIKAAPTLKKDLLQNSIGVVLPLLRDPGQAFGHQTRARWDAATTWMVENKLLAESPDLDKLLAK